MINSPQKVSGVSSVDAPAATSNVDNYVLAWTTSDRSIWWTKCPAVTDQKSYDWVKAAPIPKAASSGGPALANLKGTVWMACRGQDPDPRIFFFSLSGSTWSPGVPIPGISTSSSPALSVTDNELYLAWKGEKDNAVYWSKSSDGKAWSASAPVPGFLISDSPALACYNKNVFLAGKGASDNKIWLAQYTDAKGWGKATARDIQTSSGPALGVGDTGRLHLVWKSASDNFVWESYLRSGSSLTDWTQRAKIVGISTDARPALASQTSSGNTILLAWKGAATADLLVGPLDDLHKLYELPPGFVVTLDPSLTWTTPAAKTPPASVFGAADNVGFGWGPTQAAFAFSLVLSVDGTATFSGWYQNQGNVPLITAPDQNYSTVIVALASNKVAFTFSHSNNDIASVGVDTFNITQKNDAIAKNWAYIEAKTVKSVPQAVCYGSCTNTMDLGSFLSEIISDVESLVGDISTAVQAIAVIAAAAG